MLVEFTLLGSEVKIMSGQSVKDFVGNGAMVLKGMTVNENVVKVYCYLFHSNKVGKDSIHQGLKGGRRVCQFE